jgi:hypothetical protein
MPWTVGAGSLRAELEDICADAAREWAGLEGLGAARAGSLLGRVGRALTPLVPRLQAVGLAEAAALAAGVVRAARPAEVGFVASADAAGHLARLQETLLGGLPADLPPPAALFPSLLASQGAESCLEPLGDDSVRFCFRLSARTPDLDLLLEDCAPPTRAWTLITAWNPRSWELGPGTNAQAQARLARRLAELGLHTWPAWGGARGGRDDCLFVHGLGPDGARWLGREFEQVAVVCGRPGDRAELVLCGPRPGEDCRGASP